MATRRKNKLDYKLVRVDGKTLRVLDALVPTYGTYRQAVSVALAYLASWSFVGFPSHRQSFLVSA